MDKKLQKAYLAPYISNTDHYTYFDRYDITQYINNGENVIGVMLGDGFLNAKSSVWDFDKNVMNASPMLALTVEIKCNDEIIIFDAEDFVCKKGPILYNDLRTGVFYDARLEEKGWNDIGFAEKNWHKPIRTVNKPRGKAKICEAEPIKVYREIKPKSIKKGELGSYNASGHNKNITPFEKSVNKTNGYIYDFGENNSGIYRLKIRGTKGQKIDIQCGEQLSDGRMSYRNIYFYPDGYSQRDIYYLNGDVEEIFEPMFTFHGYRYIYVSGITEEQATEELLTYLVMSSALEERGAFECSDERANAIYKICRRSDISNFFYFPMDCPHREKNGWTGDAALSAEHMIMTMGVEKSWREWLCNIRMAQKEDGQLPGIVPTGDWGYEWGSGPAWDCVLFNLPYFAYKYCGETEIIEENAEAMLRYLEYISNKRDEKGIVAIGLGDYLPVGKQAEQYDAEVGFTDSVMVFDMCRKATIMFDAAGLALHKQFADALAQEMLSAIRRKYIDFDTYIVKNRCQTSQAMAIFYDIFNEAEKQKAFEVLMVIIEEANYNFTCGILGMRVLFHVLAEFGETELAYNMITKREFPSYGYWVDKGETTLLEHFVEYDEYVPGSKNHHFLGDVVNWFMSVIGGLKVQASNRIRINPHFIEGIDWCRVKHNLPNGMAEIYWKRVNDKIILDINCPENVDYVLESDYNTVEISKNKYQLEKSSR